MEHHAQSVEDHLVEGLSFKLRPGASYVTDRKSVTYSPHCGNAYSPRGVRVIKSMLTGDQWFDPSTVEVVVHIEEQRYWQLETLRCWWSWFLPQV